MDRLNAFRKAVLALVFCLLWAPGVRAQFEPGEVPFAQNSRALLANMWNNMGISGYITGNAYPHNGRGPGTYGSMFSQIAVTGGGSPQTLFFLGYNVSFGEGVWILTGDGKVSVTGLGPNSQWTSAFIRPLPYDPKGNREESWGVPNPLDGLWRGGSDASAVLTGSGEASLSSYWPGVRKLDSGSYYAADLAPGQTPPVIIANYALHGYIRDVSIPEEILIAQWVDIKHGIRTTRRVYNWSNPDFDDFYVTDLTFTNTGDFDGDGAEDRPGATATVDRMFIAFKNAFASNAMGIGTGFYQTFDANNPDGIDDILWYSDAPGYSGVFPPGLKAVIRRDSDNPFSPWDDTGDPFFKSRAPNSYPDILMAEGQMRAPGTYVFAPIAYADDAGMFSFNDRDRGRFVQPEGAEQPVAFKWWNAGLGESTDDPNPSMDIEADLHRRMAEPGIQANPDESDPDDRKLYIDATVYGPYTLRAGESCKIVLAYVAGHPSQMKPAPAGQQAFGILAWDRSEEPVERKQEEVRTLGEQAALENLMLAHFAYDANYHLPATPTNAFIAADDLTSSPNAYQQISWVDRADRAANPYTGEQDVLGYRVYRSTWFTWGPWELWDVVKKGASGETVKGGWTYEDGRYTYEDKDSAAGFAYHYSVRPYAKGYETWSGGGMTIEDIPVERVKGNIRKGYESGWGPPTARTFDDDERRPFQPVTDETNRLERRVLVVPNPYIADGRHQYPGSRHIRFVGIPSRCRIHIYSASGDRVQTIEHDDPGKGETVFRQITFNVSGEIQTGLYYFVVVSQTPGSEGKVQRGSFVVIK